MPARQRNPLRCFCDHCPNNTCLITNTGGLCYAEWQPKSVQASIIHTSQLSSSPLLASNTGHTAISSNSTATTNVPLIGDLSYHVANQIISAQSEPLEFEKRYNCFNKNDSLILRTIVCNETFSNTSHVIRRCCDSGDFCNKDTELLPSLETASQLFEQYHPQQHPTWLVYMWKQYSSIPIGYKIVINLALILLLAYCLGLAKNSAATRIKRRRAASTALGSINSNNNVTTTSRSAIKEFIVRIFGLGRPRRRGGGDGGGCSSGAPPSLTRVHDSSAQASERELLSKANVVRTTSSKLVQTIEPKTQNISLTTNTITSIDPIIRRSNIRNDEDFSENSSSKANSALYDSNSMTSREPLINYSRHLKKQQLQHANCNNIPHPLNQQHPGPFMSYPSQPNGKAQTTFHMTIGSGATQYNKTDTSSGSGAGQPYLTQRSIAHDIELVEVVGRGFYGVVWRGEYKGEPVAVKIFSSMAERSWERESEIYQTTMLRHKNILGFIATDKRHEAGLTSYWLVTDFYPMGSLYDFLKDNSMSMADAVRMAFSIANGLSHLHVEIFGTRGKPAIAHRDVKSKNILVKNDGTCCIADLGMAIRFNSNTGVVDVPTNTRLGTRRYLAPEILDNKLNIMDFEGVKSADIYAMGLVLWEVLRRACLVHPSTTGQIDPNFSYSIEQQQTTAPTTPSNSGGISPNTTTARTRPTTSGVSSAPLSPPPLQQHLQPPLPPPPIVQQQTAQSDAMPQMVAQDLAATIVRQQQQQDISMCSTETGADGSAGPSYQRLHTMSDATGIDPSTTEANRQQQPPISSTPQPRQLPHHQQVLQTHQQPQHQQQQAPFQDSMDTTVEDTTTDLATFCDPYEVPYQSQVSQDPTADEMRDAVCARRLRPTMSYRWSKFASMRDYSNIMTECWYEKPQARLSALRVRKSLGDIARKYFNMNMEYD